MKQIKGLLFAIMMLICFASFSQNNDVVIDSRLKEIYSETELNKLIKDAPDKIAYYNLYLNNYCSVEKSAPANSIYKGDVSIIKANLGSNWVVDSNSFDIKSFNMLKFFIPLEIDKKIYYSIGNSNTFLVFISVVEFSNIYKSQNTSK